MPARTASIGARLQLDRTAFARALSSADSDARGFARSLSSIEGPSARWTGLASKIQVMGTAMKGVASVGQTVIGAFKGIWEAGAKMEDIIAAISAVARGGESVADQMKALKEASTLPGVGLQELAAGSVTLQHVGLEAKKSRDILVEFGNALAAAGKGKADLQATTDALAEIVNNDKLDAENIKQIGSRIPVVKTIANSLPEPEKVKGREFVDILLKELSAKPRMATTAHAERDNLEDQTTQAKAKISDGPLGEAWTGALRGFSEGMEKLDVDGAVNAVKSLGGIITSTAKGVKQGVDVAAARAARGETIIDKYEVSPEERAKRQKVFDDARAQAAEGRFQAAKKVFDQENAELELQKKIAQAQTERHFTEKKALEDRLVVLKDVKKLAEAYNITIEQATQLLQGQAAAQRALKESDPNAAQFRQKTTESEQVAQLRDRGRNRAANKLEEQQTRDDRLRELQSNGFSEKDATTIADSEARRRRRQRHFDRTGRRLIGGASTPDDHKTGLDAFYFKSSETRNDFPGLDQAKAGQTGKIGGMNYDTPNSRKSTRDQDWAQVDGLNGNPPPPPREHAIRGAGAKPKADQPASGGAGGGTGGQSPFAQVHQLAQEISASLKTNNELLRQIAGSGSVASKTAPQSTR